MPRRKIGGTTLNEARNLTFKKVIVSNNGSVLDEVTFSSTALTYFIFILGHHLPNTKILSIETRPEYADLKELDFLAHLRKETFLENIELTIGVEAWSDYTRNTVFGKGLPLVNIERFIQRVAGYNFLIKTYFMLKPIAGMTDDEAIADIHCAIKWLDTMARMHQAKINLHLNPTYVSRGTKLEHQFLDGQYEPPHLEDVIEAVRPGYDKSISIFVGLSDEGLAVPGGSFIRPGDEELVELLEQFNRTQDYSLLNGINTCSEDTSRQMLHREADLIPRR